MTRVVICFHAKLKELLEYIREWSAKRENFIQISRYTVVVVFNIVTDGKCVITTLKLR